MKILIITFFPYPDGGGVSTYIQLLHNVLKTMGHEVDILSHNPDRTKYYMPTNGQMTEKNIIWNSLNEKVHQFYQLHFSQTDLGIRSQEIDRYAFEAVLTNYRIIDYDLIHCQDVISARAVQRIVNNKVPIISTIHGALSLELLLQGWIKGKETLMWNYYQEIELSGLTSSTINIIPSKWLKNILIKEFGLAEEHFEVIPNGIDIDNFIKKMGEPSSLSPPKNKLVVVCPARLTREKGHKFLLEALGKISRLRSDWICWLLGDGPIKKEIERQIIQHNLQNHVFLLGRREDLPALLKQSDIVVLPSLQDNQPFVVMEAQISGTPIVVADAGGIPEMVEHMKTGLISASGDSESLSANIINLLENTSLRNTLALNAKEWGLKQWSLNTFTQRIMKIYNTVL
ncbi:glycosyltransferase family 4 protein [Bacillus sp. JJ1521]|uniref:glycosyltransferase family 4 protein n=1 Tax=Bacillus sp. JJ1521 TaxID=3122957 RepID=UPI002FFE52CE